MPKLKNDRHEMFCHEYLKDLNATRAYGRAYNTEGRRAETSGSRLLRNVKVKQRIKELKEKRKKRVGIEADEIIEYLRSAKDINLKKWYRLGADGMSMEEFDNMPDEIAILITGVKEKINSDGAKSIYVTFFSKEKAVELLGRHLAMWNDKLNVNAKVRTIDDLLDEDE